MLLKKVLVEQANPQDMGFTGPSNVQLNMLVEFEKSHKQQVFA